MWAGDGEAGSVCYNLPCCCHPLATCPSSYTDLTGHCCCLCSYLLAPLQLLNEQREAGGPTVLLLLDALDEADDGNRGWGPVASLIAYE